MSEQTLRDAICEIGRRLYDRQLVAGAEGNLSVRLDAERVLCTPTRVSKGYLRRDELAIVDLAGQQLEGPRRRSSEILVHLAVYRHRPDVGAVIHAHPPHATAFAMTHEAVPRGFHPEQLLLFGDVPIVKYALTGTAALAEEVGSVVAGRSAVLLANHGAVTFAADLESAWHLMECLDGYCRLMILARQLGRPKRLTRRQIADLEALRARMTASE